MKAVRVSAAGLAAACLLAASGADAFPGGGPGDSMGRGPGGRHGPPSFEMMDVDEDGVVTETEFFAPMLERHEQRFNQLDQDGSGDLSSEELESARGRRGGGRRVQ